MSGGELFTVVTAWDEATKRRERAMQARCSKCPRTATVADNAGMARPTTYFADRFRRKGWRLGQRASAHVCPQCVGGLKPKPDLSPAQKRAAFCRIADVPRAASSTAKPKEAAMTKPTAAGKPAPFKVVAQGMSADRIIPDAPRQPTREDKRAIREALDACYLTDKGVYAGRDNDEAVAKRLNVPRAWVSAEREDAYGPDACEDDGEDREALAALIARAGEIYAKGLALAEEAEAVRADVRRLQMRLDKRGVA